jgi:hypothetical protein
MPKSNAGPFCERAIDQEVAAFSGARLHKEQIRLCCFPLASKLSAVRIFWCIVVQPKTFTFGSIFVFHNLPTWNDEGNLETKFCMPRL